MDTDQLQFQSKIPFVEEIFVSRLESYARFLANLGIKPPYRWVCGMTGVKGYRLTVPTPNGFINPMAKPQCLSETIKKGGVFDGKGSVQSSLLPFFDEIFHRCGIPRPGHLPR
jgi:hypothetical protein